MSKMRVEIDFDERTDGTKLVMDIMHIYGVIIVTPIPDEPEKRGHVCKQFGPSEILNIMDRARSHDHDEDGQAVYATACINYDITAHAQQEQPSNGERVDLGPLKKLLPSMATQAGYGAEDVYHILECIDALERRINQ